MKNFVQNGDTMVVAAPSGGVTSGALVVVGDLIGVAQATAAEGVSVSLALEGVFELAKATGAAISQGAKTYWISADSKCTATASGNKLIGRCVQAAGDSDTTVKVKLTPAS